MDLGLKNKNVFITGASSGIGSACAKLFCQEGAHVLIGYNTGRQAAENLCALLNTGNGTATPIHIDMADSDSINSCIEEISSGHKTIDILVLNASTNHMTPFEMISEDEWDSIFQINVKGPFFLLQRLSKIMPQGSSAVWVSSIAGQTGAPGHIHYAATKAAQINMMKSLSKHFSTHIRMNCVAPGITLTPMGEEATKGISAEYPQKMLLSRRFADPSEIANAIVFLASPISSFFYGATLDANGGRNLR